MLMLQVPAVTTGSFENSDLQTMCDDFDWRDIVDNYKQNKSILPELLGIAHTKKLCNFLDGKETPPKCLTKDIMLDMLNTIMSSKNSVQVFVDQREGAKKALGLGESQGVGKDIASEAQATDDDWPFVVRGYNSQKSSILLMLEEGIVQELCRLLLEKETPMGLTKEIMRDMLQTIVCSEQVSFEEKEKVKKALARAGSQGSGEAIVATEAQADAERPQNKEPRCVDGQDISTWLDKFKTRDKSKATAEDNPELLNWIENHAMVERLCQIAESEEMPVGCSKESVYELLQSLRVFLGTKHNSFASIERALLKVQTYPRPREQNVSLGSPTQKRKGFDGSHGNNGRPKRVARKSGGDSLDSVPRLDYPESTSTAGNFEGDEEMSDSEKDLQRAILKSLDPRPSILGPEGSHGLPQSFLDSYEQEPKKGNRKKAGSDTLDSVSIPKTDIFEQEDELYMSDDQLQLQKAILKSLEPLPNSQAP
eukprot:jgi/Botrbrau1/19046/Bobra.0100s0072.1